jgi:ribosomal protein S18 acetylase RimI-like enzyme
VDDETSIRDAGADDVRRFVKNTDDRHYLLQHLDGRRGVLLFAFRAWAFAGHIVLRLAAAEEPELRAGLPGVPLLERLRVADGQQNSGVGRSLIAAAEHRLSALGHRQVALGVHPENEPAIRLYERLAFAVWRRETLTTFSEHVQEDGRTVRAEEPCLVYVKDLPPPLRGPR